MQYQCTTTLSQEIFDYDRIPPLMPSTTRLLQIIKTHTQTSMAPVMAPGRFGIVCGILLSLAGRTAAQSTCMICSDGTKDLEYPNRVVPFFNLDGRNADPTCQEIADAASVADAAKVDCSLVQAQAGYCGCAGVTPEGKCSFCPNGAEPANMNLVAPSNDVCEDLFTYAEFLDENSCNTKRLRSIQGLGYICGCPDVEAQCSLCSDGSDPLFLDKEAFPTGETCRDMVKIIQGYTADVCLDSDTDVFVAAARCGCEGAEFPVCSVQQNTHLCTQQLLDTAIDQECECYSFCDGEFSTCHDFPGGLLTPQLCSGVAVSGCNRAVANGGNTSSAEGRGLVVFVRLAIILGVALLQAGIFAL